jgi:hypothetical protein
VCDVSVTHVNEERHEVAQCADLDGLPRPHLGQRLGPTDRHGVCVCVCMCVRKEKNLVSLKNMRTAPELRCLLVVSARWRLGPSGHHPPDAPLRHGAHPRLGESGDARTRAVVVGDVTCVGVVHTGVINTHFRHCSCSSTTNRTQHHTNTHTQSAALRRATLSLVPSSRIEPQCIEIGHCWLTRDEAVY